MHVGFVSVQEKIAISMTKSCLEKLWLIEITLATLPALPALRLLSALVSPPFVIHLSAPQLIAELTLFLGSSLPAAS